MIKVLRTTTFMDWYDSLRDVRAKAKINQRIDRLSLGHLGDAKAIGDGIMELRIHHGPGYRLYFVRRGGQVVILLCGGDKSTQRRDIERAKLLASEI